MAGAVLADEPGPVDREQDRLVVLADVVDGLVEGALEERRVDGDDRAHPAHREAGGEGDGVLLGDADVEEPLRERGLERREAGARSACPPVIATIRASVRADARSARATKTAV